MKNLLHQYRHHILLHFIVLIWGFTGILGKLISLPSQPLVWYRMLIASIGIGIYIFTAGLLQKPKSKNVFIYIAVGFVVAAHWITFFESIKVSTVSIALACLSSTTLFVAFLEPFFYKRKIVLYEVLLGVAVIIGLSLIFNFEPDYKLGILLAITSAFLAALFGTVNGLFVRNDKPRVISFYEMLGGFIAITIYFLVTANFQVFTTIPTSMDIIYLLILGLVCTAFAFVASVEVLKVLSPFTVTISINMEPVYAIILALLIFGEEEKMTTGFYFGAGLILATIFTNAFLKSQMKKRNLSKNKIVS